MKLTPPQAPHLNEKKEPPVSELFPPEESFPSQEPNLEPPFENKDQNISDSQNKEIFETTSSQASSQPVNSESTPSETSSKNRNFLKALKKKHPLKKPVKKSSLEEELQALTTQYLYLKADFENYKKQTLKEKSELLRYSGEEFIRALINEVLDDLDRAYSNLNNTKSLENFKSGIDLIYKNLQKILSRFHIEAHDPKGQPFNPNCHEALSRQPTDKAPKDQVLITFKKAYTLYEKLIRPAQVIVAVPTEDSSNTS